LICFAGLTSPEKVLYGNGGGGPAADSGELFCGWLYNALFIFNQYILVSGFVNWRGRKLEQIGA
jgi:hypothetical protein